MTIKYHQIIIWCFLLGWLAMPVTWAQEAATATDSVKPVPYVVTPVGKDPVWKVTGAISTVKGEQLEKSFTQNITNTLYGELPGLTVMQGSGEPGKDQPGIIARGYNTFGIANRSVLVIVDGFESTLDQLVPQEIESISFLKDASGVAMYGMRGANGVLLVTTKRGSIKPLEVNFSAQIGFQSAFRMPKFLDSYNYALLYDEALANDGLPKLYEGTEALNAYKNGSDPYLYPNVDWYGEVLKKSSALQNYDLNFSGGNETVTYFALVNVSDNNGLFAGTDPKREYNSNTRFTRYNVRGNVDVNITGNLSAHLTLAANIQDQKGPSIGGTGLYNKLALTPPNAFPVYNPNNTFGGNAAFSNPVGDLTETGYASYNTRTFQSNLRVTEKLDMLTEGLSASLAVAFNNYFTGNYNKTKKYPYYSLSRDNSEKYIYTKYSETTSFAVDDSGMDQWRNTNFQGSVDYTRLFGDVHQVDANVVLYSEKVYTLKNDKLKDNQFPYKYMGMRGRVSYAYGQRYIGEFTFGYEGSDMYADSQRYGFFPAFSAGWVMSNESFLEGNEVVNFLKLRASYGLAGNSGINSGRRYATQPYYQYGAAYNLGTTNTAYTGIIEGKSADPGRTWEKEKRFNIGVDATLFTGFDLTFDYFKHNRYDILVVPNATVPGLLGIDLSEMNLGKATNQGFETTLRYTGNTQGDFRYYVQGSLWYSKNKIENMDEEVRQYDYLRRTGQAIDQGFGLVALGLFRDDKDISSSPVQTFGDVRPGDIKYKDMNNDGRIDNQDACPIGYTGVPQISGSLIIGLKYKGFDFETMLYGVANRTVYLSGPTYWSFQNAYTAPESALARWTPATAGSAVYPRLSTKANPNNTQYSSFWQENGSFLKMRYIELGYSLPQNWSKAVYLSNIRFFLNGTNLFSLHHLRDLKNADPEGLEGYPTMRTLSIGVKLRF